MSDSTPDSQRKLYGELGELARYIETTLGKVRQLEPPIQTTAAQIPQASDHLTDLARLTEDGTHQVMTLTEAIQDDRAPIAKSLDAVAAALAGAGLADAQIHLDAARRLLAQDEKRLLDIMTALSFQDLVAQRIKKIVTILEDVERRLLELIVVFGLEQKEKDRPAGAVPSDGKASEMLKQLEASRSTAIKQDLVNDILEEFGFN